MVEERSDPDYHDDPEIFLVQDDDDNIQILTGEVYGGSFVKNIQFPHDDDFTHPSPFRILKVHDMVLIQKSKVIGIIDIEKEG